MNQSMDSPSSFQCTRWSLVHRSKGEGEKARAALSELCSIYYMPVLAFVRHWSSSEDAALDATHAFFEHLLGRASIGNAHASQGRFRSYLIGAAKHFILNLNSSKHAQKRGGGLEQVELLEDVPVDLNVTLAFDRDWAFALIRRAHENLERELVANGRGRQFEVLKPWLDGGSGGSLEAAGHELGMNSNALKVAIHRFRQRFLKLVRAEVESTTMNAEDAADEFRHLVDILAKG
jgi:DNA-directed RNA polymerase specialized sigma24 family protein